MTPIFTTEKDTPQLPEVRGIDNFAEVVVTISDEIPFGRVRLGRLEFAQVKPDERYIVLFSDDRYKLKAENYGAGGFDVVSKNGLPLPNGTYRFTYQISELPPNP